MATSQDIIKYRTKHGLTQAAFGKLANRKARNVQNWEYGVYDMPDELWDLLMLKEKMNAKKKR